VNINLHDEYEVGKTVKKWVLALMLMIASLSFVVYHTNASEQKFFLPERLAGMKIVVDPGHGGEDGGASNGDVVERDITLSISKQLVQQLEKEGATVIMTRTQSGDAIDEVEKNPQYQTLRERKLADLKLREQIIVDEQPDVFISVHVNAIPDAKWRGAQVFYHKEGHEEGARLAKSIQSSFQKKLKNTDREALGIQGVYLLKKSPVPSVLVETGFISNEEERKLLVDPNYQRKVADAIMEGILKFSNAEEM